MNSWPDLRHVLKEIAWVVVGGVATRAYMPERMTKDLDILVSHADGQIALQCLQDAGFKIIAQLSIPGYSLESPSGVELDILFGDEAWVGKALANPESDPAGYPVIPFPYLILMKMNTGRGRDFGDVTTMLGWADDEQRETVRSVIAQYSPEDSEDLESLIYLGQQERMSG